MALADKGIFNSAHETPAAELIHLEAIAEGDLTALEIQAQLEREAVHQIHQAEADR